MVKAINLLQEKNRIGKMRLTNETSLIRKPLEEQFIGFIIEMKV